MKNYILLCSHLLFLILLSGCERDFNENDATNIVEQKIAVSGTISAKTLSGGLSGASVFLVTDAKKKYVVKFFKNKIEGKQEIYNSSVASAEGYGPKVYFTDPAQGVMISEYLLGKKVLPQDLESNALYAQLANLLQKIHHGKPFKGNFDVFRRIHHVLDESQNKCDFHIPLAKIKSIVATIEKSLLPYQKTTPCHNDLFWGNLMRLEQEIKAIDYGDAGSGEPYFDIATVAASCLACPGHEKTLLTYYLEREPTEIEQTKLYLLEQIVLIKWACDRLRALSKNDLLQYKSLKAPVEKDFFKTSYDLNKPTDRLLFLKGIFEMVLDHAHSTLFKNSVNILGSSPETTTSTIQ